MMNIIKYALFIAALSLPVTNTHALEWVDYDGTIPDNAVMVNEGVEDRPICRRNTRIGVVNDSGKCRSVRMGGGLAKKDDFQILVDTYNVYDAVQADADMYTQTDVDDAVTAATEGLYTQAEYDAATDGMYTQFEYENAVLEGVNMGIAITSVNLRYACANDGAGFDAGIGEDRIEYMESICSGEVLASGACNQH